MDAADRDQFPKIASSTKDALDQYKIYRDYIQHEDNLVNQRMTWLLTLHGFLYASLAITIQRIAEISQLPKQIPPGVKFPIFYDPAVRIELFVYFIAIVGLAIAVAVRQSVKAARHAANAVFFLSKLDHNMFRVSHGETIFYFLQRECIGGGHVNLPWMLGGGVSHAPRFGNFSSKHIPNIIIFSCLL